MRKMTQTEKQPFKADVGDKLAAHLQDLYLYFLNDFLKIKDFMTDAENGHNRIK